MAPHAKTSQDGTVVYIFVDTVTGDRCIITIPNQQIDELIQELVKVKNQWTI